MTEPRDLIQRLTDALHNAIRVIEREDGTQHIDTARPVLAEARAYLAQPEAQGPTDEELLETMDKATATFCPRHPEAEPLTAVEYARELEVRKARAILARYSHQASVTTTEFKKPTDAELLKLMPETMCDEFSYAAKVCSDATDGQVEPGLFRRCLNTAALEYARVILAHYGADVQ